MAHELRELENKAGDPLSRRCVAWKQAADPKFFSYSAPTAVFHARSLEARVATG